MSDEQTGIGSHLRFAHVGIQFALIFGLCFYGGYQLDRHWQTKPLWTLVGVFFGFAAALTHLVREVQGWERRNQAEKSGAETGPAGDERTES